MSITVKLTPLDKNRNNLRLWDIVSQGNDKEYIIIRVNRSTLGFITTTLHPYRKFNYRWLQRLWFWFLKIRVKLGIL